MVTDKLFRVDGETYNLTADNFVKYVLEIIAADTKEVCTFADIKIFEVYLRSSYKLCVVDCVPSSLKDMYGLENSHLLRQIVLHHFFITEAMVFSVLEQRFDECTLGLESEALAVPRFWCKVHQQRCRLLRLVDLPAAAACAATFRW